MRTAPIASGTAVLRYRLYDIQPLRRRVQSVVDRRFNGSRYDAERTVARFGAHLRDEVDVGHVSEGFLVAVHPTVRPESAGVWLRGGPA